MDPNPFRDELKHVLFTLDAIDRRLSHNPGDVWPEGVAKERNGLVWHAFDLARELDYHWGIGHDASAAQYKTVVNIYVPIRGKDRPVQLSWHVPNFVEWDGSDRQEKSMRISAFCDKEIWLEGDEYQ